MKKERVITFAVWFGAAVACAQETVTVRPENDGRALINPGMGWTMHFYSNIPQNYGSKLEPFDALAWFPGCSTVYLRIPWSYVEPEEGVFNWAILDTPAQRWIARGGKVAFRITCSESWLRFATPEWVKNAGAKGVFWDYGKGVSEKGAFWDPDFVDPVFLTKLERFLQAMAARYDGNPDVAFIDIGTYGLWGEGHTGASSRVPQEKMNADVRRHIDLHVKHFPHTLLCISDDVSGPGNRSGDYPLLDYARAKGVTLRDDSILVQPPPNSWYHADQAQRYWPTLPVILEHEHYGSSVQRKAWDPALLLKSVEDYHASYLSIHWWPQEILEKNRAAFDAINRRLGYRLELREITFPKEVKMGEWFNVSWTWTNAGVAPCYCGGFPALTLKDDKGGLVAVLTDETSDVRRLPVGGVGQAPCVAQASRFRIGWIAPATRPGDYAVFVSVGRRDGTPQLALPMGGDDGVRRYAVGRLTLR
ncbi:MAG TPA: DUF4832 domain-containing protein [Kiritimatiellia bacterium]|nr:DUF4832 domain-containing protein [Kiritimatiellia bacterium]HPS06533.1 DUF4832 domain-containing protein [Kiritimatiellia bacterium]